MFIFDCNYINLLFQSGRVIIRKFKRGYTQAVRLLFPEITFDTHSFHNGMHKTKTSTNTNTSREREINTNFYVTAYYEVENRRKFFEKYADKKGFDPLKPENWYIQSRKNMLAAQVCFFISYPPSPPLSPVPSSLSPPLPSPLLKY